MERFRFREIVERLPLVLYVDELDATSSPLYVSPQIAELLGYTQEEWLADPTLFFRSLHPDDRDRVVADVERRNASGVALSSDEYRLIRRDGRVVWVRDDELVVAGPDGQPTAHGYLQDITPQRHAATRSRLVAGLLELAAEELPPAEIVRRTADDLAATIGDVVVTYVELTQDGMTRPLYTTNPSGLPASLPVIPEAIARLADGPLVVDDVHEVAWLTPAREVLELQHVRSAVDVPLLRNGEIVGVLWFNTSNPRSWTEDEVALLAAVAEQLALVLERSEAREQRVKGERILGAVSRSAQHFLTAANLDAPLQELLAALGEATGASMAYAFENVPGGDGPWPWCYRRAAWAEGDVPTLDDPRVGHTAPAPHWPRWAEALSAGETIAGRVSEIPTAEREVFELFGSRSFAAVPVFAGDDWWGFIGLEDVEDGRVWSAAEIDALRAASGLLAAALVRDRDAQQLRRRDAILDAVSTMAARLLATPSWRDEADELLRRLGVATAASRAYLFERLSASGEPLRLGQIFEWTADGIAPQLDNPAMQDCDVDAAGLHRLRERVERHEPFVARYSETTPPERALFDEQGIRSMLVVPVVVAGELQGLVGFDDCVAERTWTHAEIEALRTASTLIAAAVERERAEATLREHEQKLHAVFETALDAIFITDDHHRYVDVNPAGCAYLGVPREELIGRDVAEFVPLEARAGFDERWASFVAGGPERAEWETLRADGTARLAEASTRPNFLPGLQIAFLRDVTDRRRLEAELATAQKLESLGRLAGGVAHDFNNLLTGITGYASLLADRPDADEALRHDAGEITRAAGRAAELTRQLLAFGRRQVLTPQPLELNAVVREVAPLLDRMLGEDVELDLRLAPTVGTVTADAAQLEQVLVNLVVNARDAMPSGGTVTVETRDTDASVELVVSDTGGGMDAATAERIFEPFFTTRDDGVGLGLASVYGIVTQSGGDVSVLTAPGEGAEFTVRLPRVAEEAPAPEPAAPTPARSGSETILLVEDEDVVRDLARRVLERKGYTVLACEEGESAVACASAYDGRIDLLLTDVVMPGLRGWDVARLVREARPEIAVLYMSGYAEESLAERGELDGFDLVEKPFAVDALARRVRAALDAAAAAPAYAADSASAL